MKYSVHVSHVSYDNDKIEYQSVNQYDCLIPAVLYYIEMRICPRLPFYEIKEYRVRLYRD